MPDVIRIKRRISGEGGALASLANAELAFNEVDNTLYYGKGDNAGQATSIVPIGGSGAFQPLDGDLTSLAAASGIGVIYYRSAANTWATVTIGTGLTFSGGTLSATATGSGNVISSGTPTNGQLAQWTDATHIQGIAASSLGFESTANKGAANGYASLDSGAKVPAAQLPSYVDDVLEYANLAAFPATGSTGVIYVALDTGKIYRWSGSAYVEISPSPGSTDAVPEGTVNLYYTDARVAANATVASKAPLANPVFTGDARAVTPSLGDNDTSIATTAFVASAISASGHITDAPSDSKVYGRQNAAWIDAWASPFLTGQVGVGIAPNASWPMLIHGELNGNLAISGHSTAVGVQLRAINDALTVSQAFEFIGTGYTFGSGGGVIVQNANASIGATSGALVVTGDIACSALNAGTKVNIRGNASGNVSILTQSAAGTYNFNLPITAGSAGQALTSQGGGSNVMTWASYQPLDADLTALAALTGTNVIYYRSAADTWAAVTIGGNLSFAGGTLNAAVGTSDLASYAPLASPVFTGDPRAPTPTFGDNDTSIATTAWVTTALGGFQPLDADLTSLAAASAVGAIYYRSAANTWATVTVGAGLTFTSGTLDAPTFTSSAKGEVPASGGGTANFLRADGAWVAPAGGGDVTQAGTNTFTGSDYFNLGTNLPLVVGHSAKITTTLALEVNGISTRDGIAETRWAADALGAQIQLRKSRGTTPGTNTVVSSGDVLGKVNFIGNTGSGWQSGGPAVSGVCNSAPFGTNTPGFIQIDAVTIGGVLTTAATFKDTGCALRGVTDGSDAAAGFVGEYFIASVASGSAVALTSGQAVNITSFTLTPGDWDIALNGFFTGASNTNATSLVVSISTTSATLDIAPDRVGTVYCPTAGNVGFATSSPTATVPKRRLNITANTTVYFVAFADFTVSTLSAFGAMTARRVR